MRRDRFLPVRLVGPRVALATLIAVVAGAVVAAVDAVPAAAHGDESALSVVSAEPSANGDTEYRVRVVYQNDGEPVPGVTLTAVSVAADGGESLPVTFGAADVPGEYVGTVSFEPPGPWKVRFDVTDPVGTLTVDPPVPEAADTGPASAPPPTDVDTTFGTIPAPSTSAQLAVGAGTDDDADESSGAAIALGAALATAVALAGVVVVARRRRAG